MNQSVPSLVSDAAVVTTCPAGTRFVNLCIDSGLSIFSQPGIVPPDPNGAAGLLSLIAVTNVQIECLRKNGTIVFGPTFLSTMFAATSPGRLFDPKIIYDVHRNRFVLVVLESGVGRSRILVAVSKDGNPLSTTAKHWHFLQINSLVNLGSVIAFADYPGIAVDESAIYITANMFGVSNDVFQKPLLWIIAKEPLYSGGIASARRYDFLAGQGNPFFFFTAIPAMVRKPGGIAPGVGTYLVVHDFLSLPTCFRSRVRIVQVNRPLNNPTFQVGIVELGNLESDFCGALVDASQQAGQGKLIETNDPRALQAVWSNNHLWMTMTIGDSSDTQTAAYWLKFQADGKSFPPTLVGQGKIDGEDIQRGTFTFYPSVDVNSRGVVAFGFAAAGPRMYAGAYATIRDDLLDGPGVTRRAEPVREGEGPYNIDFGRGRNRWGDYTGMALDPADDDCFWAFNQYAGSRTYTTGDGHFGSWQTAWARLCYSRTCRAVGQRCTRVETCCSPANKLCDGNPATCKACKRIGQKCSRITECCAPANKVCEGPVGGSRTCKVCRALGQTCSRYTECCSPADKVCESRRGNPSLCKLCRKLNERCSRSSQCCRGLACSNRQCRPNK
jgi:hypothetical protein